jgi:hypothetical protein
MLAISRHGSGAVFGAVIDPTPAAGTPDVSGVQVERLGANGMLIRVQKPGGGGELYACAPDGDMPEVMGVAGGCRLLGLERAPNSDIWQELVREE